MAKKLTSKKAKEILHDKSVHGHPLTDKQRKFFGAIAGGGKSIFPELPKQKNGGWLDKYQNGGTTDDCWPGYHKNAIGVCVPDPIQVTNQPKVQSGPTLGSVQDLNRQVSLAGMNRVVAQQRATNPNYIGNEVQQKQQAVVSRDKGYTTEEDRRRESERLRNEAMRKSELAQTFAGMTPSGNIEAGVIGANTFVNMNPITGPATSMGRLTQAALGQNPYGFNSNEVISLGNIMAGLGMLGDVTFAHSGLKGYKQAPILTTETLLPPKQSGFPNPLAIADAIVPRPPHPIKIPLFGYTPEGVGPFTGSPLNFIPGYGKTLGRAGTAYRKFGNTMQHVIDTKTLSPKGGSPFRIGRDQIVGEGNWAALNEPLENYSGTFAAEFDFNNPGTNLGYINPGNRNGVLITDIHKNRLPDIPLTDQGLNFYRRLPFSNRYIPINKEKLLNNQFQWATQGGHLQSLLEKYGYGLGYAGALGAMGYPNAVEKYNKYTIDPIKNWAKENLGLDFLNNKKKNGGLVNKFDDGGVTGEPCPVGQVKVNGQCMSIADAEALKKSETDRGGRFLEDPNNPGEYLTPQTMEEVTVNAPSKYGRLPLIFGLDYTGNIKTKVPKFLDKRDGNWFSRKKVTKRDVPSTETTTETTTVDPKTREAYLKSIGYDPNRKWMDNFTPTPLSNESVSMGLPPRRNFEKEQQAENYWSNKRQQEIAQDAANKQTYIGESTTQYYNPKYLEQLQAERLRKEAQASSPLSQTMGSFSGVHDFKDYTAPGGVGSIGAKTQLIATTAPPVIAGLGYIAPSVLTALNLPLLGTVGAEYGTGALTTNNLIGLGFGIKGAKNLNDDISSGYYTSDASIWDKIGRGAETLLDIGLSPGVLKGLGYGFKTIEPILNASKKSKLTPLVETSTVERIPHNAEVTQDISQFIGNRPTNIPDRFNSTEDLENWYSTTFPRMEEHFESEANTALGRLYNTDLANLAADVRNGTITREQAANRLHSALRTNTNNFSYWDTRPIRMRGLVLDDDGSANFVGEILRNRSGFTTDEAMNVIKNKEDISKLSSDAFKETIIKPTGEVGEYAKDIKDKVVYNPSIRKTQAVGTQPLSTKEYVDEFNSNLNVLNDIIEQNNTSGIEYRVTGLDENGILHFDGPTGKSSFSVDINPGQWRGEIQDIPNEEYYKSIPGLDMRSSTASVFGDRNPRRGSRAYESINEYLKRFDLGRVKSGFNSQSSSSRPLWENAITKGKAYGFYKNPFTVNGILKTLIPGIGTSIIADKIFESDNTKENKKKNGGWLDDYEYGGEAGYTDIPFNYNSAWGGQFQNGGFIPSLPNSELKFLEPTSSKLPSNNNRSELAISIGGEDGEPALLIPSFKYGQPILGPSNSPYKEFLRTGEYLGGPFKTWQEADEWDRNIRHPYVEKGQDIPTPLRRWGKDFAMGGSLPGSTGFMYARTNSPAPSNGPYAKKTKASAENGMTYYQHGLDWKPKTISKNGSKTKPYKVDKSNIEGVGVFAKKDLKPGDYIGKAHTINQLFTDYDFTDLGKNHNHSDNPNAQNVLVGNERHFVAIKPIKKGTEITTNYRLQPDLEQPEGFEKKGWLDKYK